MVIRGTLVGLLFVGLGLWGVIGRRYGFEGNSLKPGWSLEGLPAFVFGCVLLAYGVFVLYTVVIHLKK